MKKYSVLFAALAVIVLAGCKKEEIRGGIVIGGETYQNVDKQAYSPENLAVFFDGTDNILFNGVAYNYTMIDNPTSRNTVTDYSHYALLNVPPEAIVDDVTILYPGEATITIPASGTVMVNQAANAGLPNHINNCIWPMAYHNSNFHSHGQIQLKNAVALISPAVKWGLGCFQNLVDNNSTWFGGLTSADFTTVEDIPAMVVTSVELSTPDKKLTGAAHIAFDADDIPTMVMDGAIGESADVLTVDAPNSGVSIPKGGDNFKNVGFIPVTPTLVGGTISMRVFFDLYLNDDNGTILHCVYNGEPKAVGANHIMRGYVTDFRANMNTPQNYTKIRIISAE